MRTALEFAAMMFALCALGLVAVLSWIALTAPDRPPYEGEGDEQDAPLREREARP